MATLTGMIFSARTGGNLYDLAQALFSTVSTRLPDLKTELIEIARHKVNPCNGCRYDCLLGPKPGMDCPIEDDVQDLWLKALRSDLLVYFLPTYGGLPPATWVAFQQRYHGVFRLPEAVADTRGKIAVLTVYDPIGAKQGDISQHIILHTLAAGRRPVVSFEQIIPSNYGLNSLHDRLASHAGVQARISAMSDRIAQQLQAVS